MQSVPTVTAGTELPTLGLSPRRVLMRPGLDGEEASEFVVDRPRLCWVPANAQRYRSHFLQQLQSLREELHELDGTAASDLAAETLAKLHEVETTRLEEYARGDVSQTRHVDIMMELTALGDDVVRRMDELGKSA